MPTAAVQPQNHKEAQALLEGLVNWEMPALESFARSVNELVARRKSPHLSKRETELLEKINQGIPTAALEQYNALKTKQKTTGVTAGEQAELDKLIDLIETKEAVFLGYLIDLSRLRKVSVEQLRKQLGIKTPTPHAW